MGIHRENKIGPVLGTIHHQQFQMDYRPKRDNKTEKQLEDNTVLGLGNMSQKPQKVLTIKERTDEIDYT